MTAPNRDKLLNFAANYLNISGYHDYGPQGTQMLGPEHVTKIACGVSVTYQVIHAALQRDCQMLLTHHGIFWNHDERNKKRTLALIDEIRLAELTLASYHLPLDANKNIGNSISLLKYLGFVKDKHEFAEIGWGGTMLGNYHIHELAKKFPEKSTMFLYGPGKLNKAAVITGRAGRYIEQAAEEGYDLFVTGEPEEQSQYYAKEYRINFIAAGHHWTERWGIQNLTRLIAKKHKLQWEFIDTFNPV